MEHYQVPGSTRAHSNRNGSTEEATLKRYLKYIIGTDGHGNDLNTVLQLKKQKQSKDGESENANDRSKSGASTVDRKLVMDYE